MKRLAAVGLLAALCAGQGRDAGTGATPIIFVRWFESTESDAIHRVAWRALEPHDVTRRRPATFDRDEKKARAYLQANKDAKIVVAYNPEAAAVAKKVLPEAAVLQVYEQEGAHVHARADHARFLDAMRLLGRELPWVKEGRPPPDGPFVSTSSYPDGAVLTMRPHPKSLGLHVAAQILRHLRTGAPFTRVTVRRMRLTVDLGAAKRAGIVVPIRLLARADVVRRGP